MSAIPVTAEGKPLLTPAKRPLTIPAQALADAIEAEWKGAKAFSPNAMPLTALAYTAIDRIEDGRDMIVEVMLTYVDTDTLCYRASDAALLKRQEAEWDPVLTWAAKKTGTTWQTVSGVIPLEQPERLTRYLTEYFSTMDAFRLAGVSLMASLTSSIVLALAVNEKHLTPERAFDLSRLEEESQAERWGRDEEATRRALKIKEEIVNTGRFLELLEGR